MPNPSYFIPISPILLYYNLKYISVNSTNLYNPNPN